MLEKIKSDSNRLKALAKSSIYLLILTSLFFSVFYFFQSILALDSLSMTCTGGGPYVSSSSVIISGNVTNSTGSAKVSNVNISINLTNFKTASSDSNGSFFVTFTSLAVGNYTINGTANATNFNNATCSASVTIQTPGATLSCRIKTIQFNGTVVDSGSGNVITSGNVTSSIENTNTTGASVIQSNGKFSVNITGCLNFGTRYLVTNIFDDGAGRRGWFDYIYVPT